MAKHTYIATFSANNGSTYLPNGWTYTNKRTAIREIRAAVWAEHFCQPYNYSTWGVKDESGQVVAAGALYGFGRWVNYRGLLSD
jgi:hypothetical protein